MDEHLELSGTRDSLVDAKAQDDAVFNQRMKDYQDRLLWIVTLDKIRQHSANY